MQHRINRDKGNRNCSQIVQQFMHSSQIPVPADKPSTFILDTTKFEKTEQSDDRFTGTEGPLTNTYSGIDSTIKPP